MILVSEVESWLFMGRDQADAASSPTILVEKDATGAKSFASMRTLFQLKKWTGQRRFVPLLSCDETGYRAYEVFHVDAKPPFALLEHGRVLLKDNEVDAAYAAALANEGTMSADEVITFASDYIEAALGEPVVLAINREIPSHAHVPMELFVPGDAIQTGEYLFAWANEAQKERNEAK
ncbi:hypothetical protein [Exiguobacterium aurantiacum]|uniref:hypothetical protein n=1 Tax=Exiguobacterium aurantiacum TaxID=33987 RepID=UPI0008776EFD|nr:hypothetical protein [Exiguobacterium aurantiacum]